MERPLLTNVINRHMSTVWLCVLNEVFLNTIHKYDGISHGSNMYNSLTCMYISQWLYVLNIPVIRTCIS